MLFFPFLPFLVVPGEVKRGEKIYREIEISSDSNTDIQTAASNTANLFPCVIKM